MGTPFFVTFQKQEAIYKWGGGLSFPEFVWTALLIIVDIMITN